MENFDVSFLSESLQVVGLIGILFFLFLGYVAVMMTFREKNPGAASDKALEIIGNRTDGIVRVNLISKSEIFKKTENRESKKIRIF